ncbi:MAG TPA: dTDP-4-dehydrorhamnose reductase [Chlamydiales bacterium]|nr:dTDP-4-dehydrorhamnose reductase [Chlamydiales bacterium]
MKLWITGANGLLGSTLMKMCEAIGTGHQEADIGDLASLRAFVRKRFGITHIVNCAAYSLVDLSETNREEAYRANALGAENLALIAKETGARLIHISTDYVFGGEPQRPLKETDPVSPCNIYGQSKLEGEMRVQKVLPDACILRVSWIFGNGGKNFVAKLLQMLQTQKEIRLTSDQWGRPGYVIDIAEVILRMLDAQGIYQFANAGVATKYEFGLVMKEEAEKLGIKVVTEKMIPVPGSFFSSPCKRPAYSAFDTTKIERDFQISPRHWRDALREFLVQHAPAAASL